jgi:pyrroline-5-carboxylate reductase
MMASDVAPERLDFIRRETGVETTRDGLSVVRRSQILILAVKPTIIPSVLQEIRDEITADHLVISIAAGIRLSRLEEGLPTTARVVRVMPNTPCLVGETAAGFALGRNATDADRKMVEHILAAVGKSVCLDEKLLDAVTGLSGSGPAYVYMMIEALADGGVRVGLPRDVSLKLAAQTVLGAAKMVLETGAHPGELKDRVASPGGTTIAGIHELERAGFRGAVINAVKAGTERAKELGA